MTEARSLNPLGGTMPADTVLALPPIIEDEPTAEFQTPYVVIVPNREFGKNEWDVRLNRRFNRGRCTVYDPKVAWQFINELGYKCEPMPEPLAPVKQPKRAGKKTYVKP